MGYAEAEYRSRAILCQPTGTRGPMPAGFRRRRGDWLRPGIEHRARTSQNGAAGRTTPERLKTMWGGYAMTNDTLSRLRLGRRAALGAGLAAAALARPAIAQAAKVRVGVPTRAY